MHFLLIHLVSDRSKIDILSLSVSLTDDQRRSSEAGVPFLPVLPQPPEHRGAAALARPRQASRWLQLWTLWRENSNTHVFNAIIFPA